MPRTKLDRLSRSNFIKDGNAEISKNVQKIMLDKGMSKEDLATASGMKADALRRKLRGATKWTADDLFSLAFSLGVSVQQFF